MSNELLSTVSADEARRLAELLECGMGCGPTERRAATTLRALVLERDELASRVRGVEGELAVLEEVQWQDKRAAQPEAVGLWQYRPKHPKTGEVVGPWMSCQDVERARACGYEVRQVRECRACDGEGWTEQGDPEIGSAKFDCPTCNGDGCLAAAPTTEATSSPSDAERLDAARYQWLREHSDSMSLEPQLTVAKVNGWGLEGWSGDDLDAAIDAAIRATKGGEP